MTTYGQTWGHYWKHLLSSFSCMQVLPTTLLRSQCGGSDRVLAPSCLHEVAELEARWWTSGLPLATVTKVSRGTEASACSASWWSSLLAPAPCWAWFHLLAPGLFCAIFLWINIRSSLADRVNSIKWQRTQPECTPAFYGCWYRTSGETQPRWIAIKWILRASKHISEILKERSSSSQTSPHFSTSVTNLWISPCQLQFMPALLLSSREL